MKSLNVISHAKEVSNMLQSSAAPDTVFRAELTKVRDFEKRKRSSKFLGGAEGKTDSGLGCLGARPEWFQPIDSQPFLTLDLASTPSRQHLPGKCLRRGLCWKSALLLLLLLVRGRLTCSEAVC